MRQPLGIEILRGDTSVDIEAMRREVSVDLASEADEAAYQQMDWRLSVLVQQVATAELGTEKSEALVAIHSDWYPNKTKALSCELSAISGLLPEFRTPT